MTLPRMRVVLPWSVMALGVFVGAFGIGTGIPTTLSEPEAVRLAERFVRVNGYTDLPPDRSRLVPESVVYSTSADEELNHRRNTLEKSAVGAAGGVDRWVVYFQYQHRDTEYRRAVVMDVGGGHVHIMHQDAY